MKYRFIFVLIVFSLKAYSQGKEIFGRVLDAKTKKQQAGVSIYIENTYLGTVTNSNGYFKLKIPEQYCTHQISISSIGYQKQEVRIEQIVSPLNIKLQKDTTQLNEVLVMPKDRLLALLRRAYGKIKDNYSDVDTRMEGFYRESYYVPHKNEYLYFGEALLDIFKTSYRNKTEGQVKIVNSRMNKHPLYDSLSRVMWYGGVQLPLNSDKVKIKAEFITPSGFKKYNYSISKTLLGGGYAYKVEFMPKNEAKYKGVFYLDTETLAYLYFDCTYSTYGKVRRNRYLSTEEIKSISRRLIARYLRKNEKYYLSYISDCEELYNKRTKSNLVQFNEYLTTDIDSEHAHPIPFKEQAQLRDVFYLKAEDYLESDWKDQIVIEPDSSLNKLIEYSSEEANQLLNKQYFLPKGHQFKRKLIEVISRMYFDIDFETRTVSGIAGADISYTPALNQNFSKNFNAEEKQTFFYGMKIGYKLNPHFDVNFYAKESLSGNYSKLNSLGISFETPIVNRGRQLFLMSSVNYYFSQDGYHVGNFNSGSTFKAGGKKIRADRIALYVGKKKQGVSFDFGLRTPIHKFYNLFVSGGYRVDFQKKDRLFIQEKSGFFLTRKKTDVSLRDTSVKYFEKGNQTTKNSFNTKSFTIKAGLRFSF